MALSKVRQVDTADPGPLTAPEEGDLKPYEVFIQLDRGSSHVHAGTVDAPNDDLALDYAKRHYGRDQECVHLWVVPRSAILTTDYANDVIWPLTDQGYRLARGYAADVRRKWEQVRKLRDIVEYEKEDLKETF
ncbi:MAG: hypothetical protein FLDDKLPJ_02943 [Phycisphaerae bacterium]|nr:hypothetical protein [Phycisphaerae bacterium]